MRSCDCCGRTLLVGETFRLYRRRFRRTGSVCELCMPAAVDRGIVTARAPRYRQMTARSRPVRRAAVDRRRVHRHDALSRNITVS